jgi:hypothetical protein
MASGLVAALMRETCVEKHRLVVTLVTDISGGRRPCRASVKRDQRMRPTSPAVRCRLRRRLIPAANESGRPIALDLAAAPPHLHRRPPGDPNGQYRRGLHPPAPSTLEVTPPGVVAGQAVMVSASMVVNRSGSVTSSVLPRSSAPSPDHVPAIHAQAAVQTERHGPTRPASTPGHGRPRDCRRARPPWRAVRRSQRSSSQLSPGRRQVTG